MKTEAKESMRSIGKVLGITLAVYAGLRWLFTLVIPFFAAFLLAKLLNPLTEKLENKLKLKRGIWASLLVGILLLLLGLAVFFFLKTLLEQLRNIMEQFPSYKQQAGVFWEEC